MRGVKPSRNPRLWEACVNAIVFQQVSLRAANTIMHRLVFALWQPVEVAGRRNTYFTFPSEESFQSAQDDLLRPTG
jgi:DNA-3-methyladenine glycosylase II